PGCERARSSRNDVVPLSGRSLDRESWPDPFVRRIGNWGVGAHSRPEFTMIVQTNPRQELGEFYPPPYDFLDLPKCPNCGLRHTKVRGMGDSTAQIQDIATTGASTTVSLLTSFSVIGGPWGAAAGAVIAVGSLIAGLFKGCGSSCVLASNDANKIWPVLQQNLQAYLSAPVHYKSLQEI